MLLLGLIFSMITVCYCQGNVIESAELDTCEGSLNLVNQAGESQLFTKTDIIETKGAFKGFYVENGERQGTCCFRLRSIRRYTDISKAGNHNIRMKIKSIELIECISTANVMVPVLCSTVALILLVFVGLVLWRRRRRAAAGQLPVPTQEQ